MHLEQPHFVHPALVFRHTLLPLHLIVAQGNHTAKGYRWGAQAGQSSGTAWMQRTGLPPDAFFGLLQHPFYVSQQKQARRGR